MHLSPFGLFFLSEVLKVAMLNWQLITTLSWRASDLRLTCMNEVHVHMQMKCCNLEVPALVIYHPCPLTHSICDGLQLVQAIKNGWSAIPHQSRPPLMFALHTCNTLLPLVVRDFIKNTCLSLNAVKCGVAKMSGMW